MRNKIEQQTDTQVVLKTGEDTGEAHFAALSANQEL